MDLKIRRALPDDAGELTRIAQAAKRYWRYPAAYLRLWAEDLTVTPAFIREHPVYCAVQQARVLGFYALSREGATYELEHLWVDPEHIGRGIGSGLWAHLTGVIRASGGGRLRIVSDPNAEGFYRRQGAARVGEVPSRPAGRMLPLLVLDLPA